MENLIFAYLGDAVYELYIREYLVKKNIGKVNELNKETIKYVSAKAQSEILDNLINNNILNDFEQDLVRKARNTHSHANKSVDIPTYKKATGLECVIGYLYLNDKNRLNEIMEVILNESNK